MSRRERSVQLGLMLIVLLHGAAFLAWPGALWGASHLSVWPRPIGIGWTLMALSALIWLPRRLATRSTLLAFPGRRGALIAALAAGVVFWLLRERQHFFGDGYHLVRSQGRSPTFLRAPLLVRLVMGVARVGEEQLGLGVDTSIALASVLAGALVVYMGFRLSSMLGDDSAQRWLAAALLGSAGALQLFFGHVEYYALLAASVVFYLLVVVKALRGRLPLWSTWLAFAVLPTMHLSALGLALAQLLLGVQALRRGEWRSTLLAALGAVAIVWGLLQVTRSGADTLAAQAVGGLHSYVEPYFDTTSTRHAFSFLGWSHLRAVFNDLLLTAPLAWALLPAVWLVRRVPPQSAATLTLFMGVAALGCLAINVLFNREIGPYRDWDTLAPYAFVYLVWIALVVGPTITQPRQVTWMLVAIALFHGLPWTALNAVPSAATRHIRLVLTEEGLWSPYARGVMHEEFAVQLRNRGDLRASLRDYEAASRATPTDARYHQGLGEIWYRLGEPERAVREWELALRWRPDYFPAHNNLAALLAFEGRDLARARHHAQTAVRLEPESADAWFTFADVHARLGELDVARRAYQQALRLRPGWGRAQRSLEELEKAARRQPEH